MSSFVLGCILPGGIVFAVGRKKASNNIALLGMLACGIASIMNWGLSLIVAVAAIVIMGNLSKRQIRQVDDAFRNGVRSVGGTSSVEEIPVENLPVENLPAEEIPEEVAVTIDCPRCGAPVHVTSKSVRCEYCDSVVMRPRYESKASTTRTASTAGTATTARANTATSGSYTYTQERVSPNQTADEYGNVHVEFDVKAPKDHFNSSGKSRTAMAILCFFFGAFGVHRFYAGRIVSGIIYVLTLGFCGFGVIIDMIVILMGNFKDKNGRKITRW